MKPIISETVEAILKDKEQSDILRKALFGKDSNDGERSITIGKKEYRIESVPRNPK